MGRCVLRILSNCIYTYIYSYSQPADVNAINIEVVAVRPLYHRYRLLFLLSPRPFVTILISFAHVHVIYTVCVRAGWLEVKHTHTHPRILYLYVRQPHSHNQPLKAARMLGKIDRLKTTKLNMYAGLSHHFVVCLRAPLFTWAHEKQNILSSRRVVVCAALGASKRAGSFDVPHIPPKWQRLVYRNRYCVDLSPHTDTQTRGLTSKPI